MLEWVKVFFEGISLIFYTIAYYMMGYALGLMFVAAVVLTPIILFMALCVAVALFG